MAIEERYVYLNIQYDRYRQADRRTKRRRREALRRAHHSLGQGARALQPFSAPRRDRWPPKKHRYRRGQSARRRP